MACDLLLPSAYLPQIRIFQRLAQYVAAKARGEESAVRPYEKSLSQLNLKCVLITYDSKNKNKTETCGLRKAEM